MAKHVREIASVEFHEGQYRFCLDEVLRDDEDGRTEYAFVWRGNKKTPEGFVPKSAYFDWPLLGDLIRKAVKSDPALKEKVGGFLISFLGI